jgi:hypothetical protein
MNRIHAIAASTVMILCSLPMVQGASKPADESSATNGKRMITEIDTLSAVVSDAAFRLNAMAKRNQDSDLQVEGLNTLREDVNKIGSDLRSLQAQRDSLPAWEARAIDDAAPLMHDVANNTEKAISAFNSNPTFLKATSYVENTSRIYEEAHEVGTRLHGDLTLSVVPPSEASSDRRVGGVSGN